jgi:hypothetical protein
MAVGHFFDGTARPMATAIALAGCMAAIAFRSLRRGRNRTC